MNKKNMRWGLILLGVLAVAFSTAFAGTDDCKNPIEIPLKKNVKMKFCEVPAGSVLIRNKDVSTHEISTEVKSLKGFQMGMYTVTQAQYAAVTGERPWLSRAKRGGRHPNVRTGDNIPAIYINTTEVFKFIEAMNLIDSSAEYRLPTEDEFDYVARAGATTEYYWGDELDPSYVYFSGNAHGYRFQYIWYGRHWTKQKGIWGNYWNPVVVEFVPTASDVTTCPNKALDQRFPGYCANSFGLMHVLGNVWQATHDGPGSKPVYRGSGWENEDNFEVNKHPAKSYPLNNDAESNYGFRLVRTPK